MSRNRLAIENAVLRQAGPLQPIMTRQVILALEDREYAALLDYDDRDELNPASVNRALKRLAAAEPNLFYKPDAVEALDDGSFKSKAPGSVGGSNSAQSKEDETVNGMLAAIGLNKDSAQQ